MNLQDAITDAYLAVSCVSLAVQGWALIRLRSRRSDPLTAGLYRTALCRVAGAITYVYVGLNALVFQWAIDITTFTAFALIQIMYWLNARADVRLKRKLVGYDGRQIRSGVGMVATPASRLGLSEHQYANLIGIVASVKSRKWSVKAAYIAVEATLDESGMRILASANVPASQQYPHDLLSWTSDGLGHDHASMGMLQQQTGYAWTPAGYGRNMNQTTIDSPNGWGTPAELMHPQTSTDKFLNALANHPWSKMSNWAAAQAVQGSAYSDGSNYQAFDSIAQKYVNAVWAAVKPSTTPTIRKRRTMFVYYVPNIPGGGANCFTFNGEVVRRVIRTANLNSVLAALGQAHAEPVDYQQHLEWVQASPTGRVYK